MLRQTIRLLTIGGALTGTVLALATPSAANEPASTARRAFGGYVVTLPARDLADEVADFLSRADADPPQPPPPAAQELSPELRQLQQRIERTLDWYYERPENAATRSVWGVMHGLIAYGVDTHVVVNGKKVNAIGWVCYNGTCRGQRLFSLQNGKLLPKQGVGVQGHHGQFLAMLAQSRVKSDFPILVDDNPFTVADLIEFEKRTCYSKTELTFKLIALAHYLPSDATWLNDRGETWSIPRLIREELDQPIIGAACGGTHRLTGFSYAVNKRLARGEPMTGEWLRAQQYEKSYQDYLMRLQNPDGSFSTQWFAGRADFGDDAKKLETTGHMAEWMVYSLSKEQLTEGRVVRAVDFLDSLLWRNRNANLAIGPKGHALHALVMYQERLFGASPGQRNARLANRVESSAEK